MAERTAWANIRKSVFQLTVEYEFKYLIKETRSSALSSWLSLLSHFQKSTMPRRIAARQQLYSIVHDPSKSMDIFIHSVTSAAKVLADLGYKVDDTEIKDILLMKLDESYSTVSVEPGRWRGCVDYTHWGVLW